jgi:NADH dehydrogenase/NADH:ubiquinone oxidoreductase subunit G
MVELTVDGRTIQANEGELLVHALARNDIFIPTLCHDAKLDPYGGCRVCVVELEGAPRPVPTCATRAEEGMAISTNGRAGKLRRTLT